MAALVFDFLNFTVDGSASAALFSSFAAALSASHFPHDEPIQFRPRAVKRLADAHVLVKLVAVLRAVPVVAVPRLLEFDRCVLAGARPTHPLAVRFRGAIVRQVELGISLHASTSG